MSGNVWIRNEDVAMKREEEVGDEELIWHSPPNKSGY